jgi:endoglucanase
VLASGVAATTYAATNLNASTTYYFIVNAVNSGGTSAASNQATATTQAAAALPAAPANVTAAASSSSQINVSWTPSSTAGVKYTVYSGTSPNPTTAVASGITSTTYAATGLNASTTYYFVVKAVSTTGTTSGASNQASAQTQAASATGGSCHVSYTDQNDWGSGFTGALSITNTASVALKSWVLTWTDVGNQQITQSWNGNYTQSGKAVTLSNASWNGAIAAGQTLSGIGFNANYSGTNTAPTIFYLNGVACH